MLAVSHLYVEADLDAHALLGLDADCFLLGLYLKFRQLSQRLHDGQDLAYLRGLILLGDLFGSLELHVAGDLRRVLHLAHWEVDIGGDLAALAVDVADRLRDHRLVRHGL